MKLRGKTVLVTGGAGGIGQAICCEFANQGAKVAFTYKSNVSSSQELRSKLEKANAFLGCYKVDVRDRAGVEAVKKDLEKKIPEGITTLVNNAGVNKPADFDSITDLDWDDILSVNLKGVFIVSQIFFPFLARSGNSSIVNIGSVSGQYGGPRTAHYAASKAGLVSLSQVMARFGSDKGIRSNTLAVGLIHSDMGAAGLVAPSVKKAAENIISGRLGSYQEVANSAVFLASDDSSYVTAQTLNVNGGLYF